MSTRRLPRRSVRLHSRDLGTEIVVVDETTQQAHVLHGASADLWRGIDEGNWPIATEAPLSAAMTELGDAGLIEAGGLTRRALLARGGGVSVAGAVITIGLPSVAMARSNAATSMSVAPALQAVRYGATYTITATVSSTNAVPTGYVQLHENSGRIATDPTANLDSTGKAVFTLIAPASTTLADSYTVTYVSVPAPDFQTSTGSSGATFSVNGNTKQSTTTVNLPASTVASSSTTVTVTVTGVGKLP